MKLLFLSALYPPQSRGGGEISTHLLASALVERGHKVRVITQGAEFPWPFTAKPLFEEIHAHKIAQKLAPEIDWESYDIIHAHDFRMTQILAELIKLNVVTVDKTVTTVRDYAQICGSPNNLLADYSTCPDCHSLRNVSRNLAVVEAPLIRKPFRMWQYRYNINYRLQSFRCIPRHVYISQAQLAQIKQVQNLNGITATVIYNSIGANYLAGQVEAGKSHQLLYVGTIDSYKGVGLLLAAFRTLAAKNSEVTLKLVGEGAQKKKYERQVKAWGLSNRVSFIGRKSWNNLPAIYDEAAIVVAPHIWYEPFGRTVVEAMARGKVVITAAAGGPGEIIDDGKTGFLFERGSSADLQEKLEMALHMDLSGRANMGQAAQTWVQRNLSLDMIVTQYENFYSKKTAL